MKSFQIQLLTLLILAFVLPQFASAQAPNFAIHKTYPYISITKNTLKEAKTIEDLDPKYKSEWVRAYVSVEISTTINGVPQSAKSNNNVFSTAQKDMIVKCDAGTDILVNIKYVPENTLKQNSIKELDFKVAVLPETDADFTAGQGALRDYLRATAIDKIPAASFKNYDLAAVTFTVFEDGKIGDVKLFESSKNKEVDALLLAAIESMPSWKPAQFTTNVPVKQGFVLTVGNMENCMVHLLNIDQK